MPENTEMIIEGIENTAEVVNAVDNGGKMKKGIAIGLGIGAAITAIVIGGKKLYNKHQANKAAKLEQAKEEFEENQRCEEQAE